MEQEQLKNAWNALDNSQQRQEMLQKALRKDNLAGKSDRGLNRIINHTYFSLAITIGVLPAVIYAIIADTDIPYGGILLWMALIFVPFAIVINITELRKLQKIDLSGPVSENLRRIQDYRRWVYKWMVLSYIAVGILLAAAMAVLLLYRNLSAGRWAFVCGVIGVGAIVGWWEYRQLYRKNINAIQQSLEELKELESDR
jgi:FtsH-binding integral membrane protein